jgi:hypothetical protein
VRINNEKTRVRNSLLLSRPFCKAHPSRTQTRHLRACGASECRYIILRDGSTRCFVIAVSGDTCHRMLYVPQETVGLKCSAKYSWISVFSWSEEKCCASNKLAARNRTEAHRHGDSAPRWPLETSLIAASELYCRLHFTCVKTLV